MRLAAAYLPGAAEPNAADLVPEASRRARGVPVYAALRSLGREGVADLVDRCCDLASRMAGALSDSGRLRVLNEVSLNQVLAVPEGVTAEQLAAVVPAIAARVQAEGTCWLGPTVYRGTPALRVSVSNWSTSADDVDRSAAAIVAATAAETGSRPKAPTGIEPV